MKYFNINDINIDGYKYYEPSYIKSFKGNENLKKGFEKAPSDEKRRSLRNKRKNKR